MPRRTLRRVERDVLATYSAGNSQRDTAARFGINHKTVGAILRRYHFPSMHNPERRAAA